MNLLFFLEECVHYVLLFYSEDKSIELLIYALLFTVLSQVVHTTP